MDTISNAFWITQKRLKCFNILLTSIKDLMIQFWTFQIVIFPNRKNVVRWRISIKVHEKHVAHYL
jgi:hypothetical protein